MSNLTYAIADPIAPFYFLNIPLANISIAYGTINIGSNHNFVTGNHVWFTWWLANSSADSSGGIRAYTKYFVIVVDSTTIKLASTLSNAINNIAINISTFASNINGINIYKYANPSSGSLPVLPEHCPAYTRSDVIFNSSIPVQVDFTIPTYSELIPENIGQLNSNMPIPVMVLFKQEGVNACWGITLNINPNNDSGRGRSFNGTVGANGSNGSNLAITSSGITLGYRQRYIINTNRQIECWYAAIGSSLTLVYTTTALAADTRMRLEFGSNFSFAKVIDCTFRYL